MWDMEEIVAMMDEATLKPGKRGPYREQIPN
jgi:hypothetical protein